MLIDVKHEKDENGNVFVLREDIEICWDGKSFTIPAGFKSDGASVPRFFWRADFPPGDYRAMRAAFAHDYVYRIHPDGWTKDLADTMFFGLLVKGGIPAIQAWLAYLGVWLFGWIAWRKRGEA